MYEDEELQKIYDDIEEINDEIETLKRDSKNSSASVSGSGETILLNSTAEAEFKIPPLPEGNSEQETTEGTNILPNNIQSQSINGLTITKNNDGSITINGTSNAWTNLSICSGEEIQIEANSSGGLTYIYGIGRTSSKIETTGSKTGILYFDIYNVNTKLNSIQLNSSTASLASSSYTATENVNITRANLECASDVTFTNCNIKLWTNRGTTINDYEKFTYRSKSKSIISTKYI